MTRRAWTKITWCAIALLVLIVVGFLFRDSRMARNLMALAFGELRFHGAVGVEFGEATAAPLTIKHVVRGSGADKAGLEPGDVVVAAGPAKNPDLATLVGIVKATKPEEELEITVRRGTEEIVVQVRLISIREYTILKDRERSNKNVP